LINNPSDYNSRSADPAEESVVKKGLEIIRDTLGERPDYVEPVI